MQSLMRMASCGSALVKDRPSKRDAIEMLLRQDAWSHLRHGAGYNSSLAWRLSEYAKGEDYWQVWFAIEYLQRQGGQN